jgi:ABC-type amino acid transport substrate-binding protein
MMFRLHYLFALCLWLYSHTSQSVEPSPVATAPSTMIIRYHNAGEADIHNGFQFELIRQALEVTRAEFGDYLIHPYNAAPTAKRQAILLGEGTLMNMQWASPGTPIAQGDVIQVPVDIMQGLMGFRVCLLNRHQLANFAEVKNLADLRKFTIGQGQDWTDKLVYLHNKIPLVEAPGLENLFPFLASGRVDCLALGIHEIGFKYRHKQTKYPELSIEPNVLLYYDFPTYLYISKHDPQLAERMTQGLQKLEASGAYGKLFAQYFAQDIAPLRLHERTIICLKSPYLSQESQCNTPVTLPKFIHN